jgi:hypothetical protein
MKLDRGDDRLRPPRHPAERHARLAGTGDALVPQRLALWLEGQRLHRLDPENGLAQCRGAVGLGGGDFGEDGAERTQRGEDDEHDQHRAGQHHPGEDRVQIEEERQQDEESDQIEKGAEQLAGEKLADLIDMADLVHRLAGGVVLEIIERQAEETIEDMQIELGIHLGADRKHDQPPGMAEKRFVDHRDPENRREQDQGRNAVMRQHPIDDGHDQERRKNGEKAEGQRGKADIAQRTAFADDHASEPGQGERRVGRNGTALRPQQHGSALPNLGQAQLVDRQGVAALRILDERNIAFAVDAGQQTGAPIGEQQNYRPGIA